MISECNSHRKNVKARHPAIQGDGCMVDARGVFEARAVHRSAIIESSSGQQGIASHKAAHYLGWEQSETEDMSV